MKKSLIVSILGLQILMLLGIVTNTYFTFMNKGRIRATQRVMVETQEKLGSTFEFMDKVVEQQAKMEEAQKPIPTGVPAPEFALKDENAQLVKLADLKGSKILLVFSQESCPYCKDFYPVLNEFQKEEQNIKVVIMQVNSSPEQNKKYKQQERLEFPVLAATSKDFEAYKVKATPTSVLLDEEGTVLGSETITSLEDLKDFVNKSCANCMIEG